MRRSGWEAPTYPSFDFRQSAEKCLVLSMKLASARTLRARGSGTGPGRWVDLASLKASRPRMYALGRAGRPRSRHFTAKRLSKTKLALHTHSIRTEDLGELKVERRFRYIIFDSSQVTSSHTLARSLGNLASNARRLPARHDPALSSRSRSQGES
jgi:hypothetical protein